MTTITQSTLKLIKNLIFTFALTGQTAWGKELFKMQNPSGVAVELDLALTRNQHTQGLSGLKSNDFKDSRGMLFVNPEVGLRRFWMPDTYFNLDIIFLDPNLKIVGIEKNVPAHPGNSEPPAIYKTDTYSAQFVLETKAGAAFGKKLKKNDQLKFTGPTSLSEIVLKTRQQQ
ncbi:MAG: DUF192 domain-containing protein [Bacteriovorax sp.]|nr:DUF192 domain-containing protein [Bacteriovorax sp.]